MIISFLDHHHQNHYRLIAASEEDSELQIFYVSFDGSYACPLVSPRPWEAVVMNQKKKPTSMNVDSGGWWHLMQKFEAQMTV
jgi:hypothetical protein